VQIIILNAVEKIMSAGLTTELCSVYIFHISWNL